MQRAAVSPFFPPANSAFSPDSLQLGQARPGDRSTRLDTSFWWVGEIEQALESQRQTTELVQPVQELTPYSVDNIDSPIHTTVDQISTMPRTWVTQHGETASRASSGRQNHVEDLSNHTQHLNNSMFPNEAYFGPDHSVPYSSSYRSSYTPDYRNARQPQPSALYQHPTPPPSEKASISTFGDAMPPMSTTWTTSRSMQTTGAPVQQPMLTSAAREYTFPGAAAPPTNMTPTSMHGFQPSPAPAIYYTRPSNPPLEASQYPSFNVLPTQQQNWNLPPTPCNTPGYSSEMLCSDWPPSTMAPRDVRSEGTLYPGAFTAPCQLSPPSDSKQSTETTSSQRPRPSLRRRPKPADLRGKYLQEAATKSRYRKKATREAAMQLGTAQ